MKSDIEIAQEAEKKPIGEIAAKAGIPAEVLQPKSYPDRAAFNRALEERIAADKVRPEAQIRYFVPDERKAGGRYVILRGAVKKIDEYSGVLLLTDGKKIPLGDILSIEPI